jgi:hypothetical protein
MTDTPHIDALAAKLPTPNQITTDMDGYYISYNERDENIWGTVTTAIVNQDQTKFLVLKGDHRTTLDSLPSYSACVAYFRANPAHHHRWSDQPDALPNQTKPN